MAFLQSADIALWSSSALQQGLDVCVTLGPYGIGNIYDWVAPLISPTITIGDGIGSPLLDHGKTLKAVCAKLVTECRLYGGLALGLSLAR